MLARKVTSVGVILGALALSLAAQAETKRYLVRFKSPATFAQVSQTATSVARTAPGVMAPMRLFGGEAVVAKALKHVELLVIESEDERAVQSLRKHPAIGLVEEEIFHPAPKTMATWTQSDALINAVTPNLDQPWGIGTVKAPEAWNTTKGQGARVLVLDTGLDKDHPAVSANFEKGVNFTGANRGDFSDQVGHGTHVSGTILAAGRGGLVGVAPEAKLLMGKVCTDRGCSSIAIADGLDFAVQEKVDVVNMSLGGMFLSSAEAQALAKAEQGGVFIAAATGNDGTARVSYPAAVDTVLAVGAIDDGLKKADFSQWGPELDVVAPGVDVISSVPRGTGRGAAVKIDINGKGLNTIKSLPFVGSPVANVANGVVVFANLGKPEDFRGLDLRGKIALISRGEIPFKDKVTNAIQAGASGVVIYNNAPGLIQGQLTDNGSEVAIPAAMIEQSEGESAKMALTGGQPIRISLVVERTDYASFQGTSMATPHVAGVAALVRAANKGLTPAQVREVLKSTATPLSPNGENQFGSGLVNAEAAVAKALSMRTADLKQASR